MFSLVSLPVGGLADLKVVVVVEEEEGEGEGVGRGGGGDPGLRESR